MARKIRKQDLKDDWEENVNEVLYRENLPYIPENIEMELINRHKDNLLASHFGIDKTRELIAQKYY